MPKQPYYTKPMTRTNIMLANEHIRLAKEIALAHNPDIDIDRALSSGIRLALEYAAKQLKIEQSKM